jgi:hypothetical protein
VRSNGASWRHGAFWPQRIAFHVVMAATRSSAPLCESAHCVGSAGHLQVSTMHAASACGSHNPLQPAVLC